MLNTQEHRIVRGLIFDAHRKKLKFDEDNCKVALKVWKQETVSSELLRKLKFELEVALWTHEHNGNDTEIKQLITEMNRDKNPQDIERDNYDADAATENFISEEEYGDGDLGIIDSTYQDATARKFKFRKTHVSVLNYIHTCNFSKFSTCNIIIFKLM